MRIAGRDDPLGRALMSWHKPPTAGLNPSTALRPGEAVALVNVPAGRALILARSENCPYCRASVTFHAALIRTSIAASLPVILLIPASDNVDATLAALGTDRRSVTVRTESLSAAGIPGVPTIILSQDRKIEHAWVGALPEAVQHRARLGGSITRGRAACCHGSRDARAPWHSQRRPAHYPVGFDRGTWWDRR